MKQQGLLLRFRRPSQWIAGGIVHGTCLWTSRSETLANFFCTAFFQRLHPSPIVNLQKTNISAILKEHFTTNLSYLKEINGRWRKNMEKKIIEYDETLAALYGGQRFHSISTWLKREFGEKTIKLAIDGGFTCPNRDGSKGTGGCLFCSDSGSGEFASTIDDQIRLLSDKWPKARYLAYFQNHTNTYAPVSVLREKYQAALKNPKVHGLVIGTRPDCLSEEVLDLLSEIKKDHFLWLELGLQTIHEETAALINRCYPLEVFDDAMTRLHHRNLPVVVHLILGLPGESQEMMLDSVRYVSQKPDLFGMKLHLLNVVKDSPMAHLYPDYQPFPSIEAYVDLVVRALELIPPRVTIHRLTGDAPRSILINPPWSFNKRTILNGINDQLHLRDTWQGKKSLL
jgi:hypothetical protein